MTDYRCYVLDESNHVIFPAEIVAEDLGEALRHGLVILKDEQDRNPDSRANNLEVWEDDRRVFPHDAHSPANRYRGFVS